MYKYIIFILGIFLANFIITQKYTDLYKVTAIVEIISNNNGIKSIEFIKNIIADNIA